MRQLLEWKSVTRPIRSFFRDGEGRDTHGHVTALTYLLRRGECLQQTGGGDPDLPLDSPFDRWLGIYLHFHAARVHELIGELAAASLRLLHATGCTAGRSPVHI